MAIVEGLGTTNSNADIAEFLDTEVDNDNIRGVHCPAERREDYGGFIEIELKDGRTVELTACDCCEGIQVEVKDPRGRSH